MNPSDDARFGVALHDRVGDAAPNLDDLVRVSQQRGRRIRRTRRALAGVGLVAVLAGAGLGVTALPGGSSTATDTPVFADTSSPTAADALAAGDVIDLPSGAKARVYSRGKPVPDDAWPPGTPIQPVPAVVIPSDEANASDDTGFFLIAVDATDADLAWLQTQYADSKVPILVTRGPLDPGTDVAPLPTPTPTPTSDPADATSPGA